MLTYFEIRMLFLDETNYPVKEFVEANYRPGFKYADFASSFTAKFFDAKKWAKIIAKSRAKYLSSSFFVCSLLRLLLFRLFIVTFHVLRIAGATPVLPYLQVFCIHE